MKLPELPKPMSWRSIEWKVVFEQLADTLVRKREPASAYHSHVGRYCHVSNDAEDLEEYSCLYLMQQSNARLLSRMFLDCCLRSAGESIVAADEPHKYQLEHITDLLTFLSGTNSKDRHPTCRLTSFPFCLARRCEWPSSPLPSGACWQSWPTLPYPLPKTA